MQANTFGAVAEEYITRKIAKTEKAKESERDIRNELIARWGERPITEVTRHDVVEMAEEIAKRAPYQAHNVFGQCRALFNWAIARGLHGLETSPCDRLKPADLIGRKEARSRVLSDRGAAGAMEGDRDARLPLRRPLPAPRRHRPAQVRSRGGALE